MHMKSKIDFNKILPFVFFVCPFIIMVYCFSSGISGNDFWWHIKVGEHILEFGTVPTSDIFSWYGTELGIKWTAHEWLADVVYFGIYNTFDQIGIFIFSIGAAMVLYSCLWQETKKYWPKNILFSGLFFSLFAVLSSLFFYGRPHVFSYFFLFGELKFLYEFVENQRSKKIFLIPLLAVFWSNFHGGSSNLTYILCLVFAACGLCGFSLGRIEANKLEKASIVKLLTVALLSVGGILINPVGLQVLIYPYVNLSDELSMALISEWAAPDAKMIGNLILYFLPIGFMTIGLISEKKKIRLIDLVVMIAFLFLFFRSARFIMLWYIAAAFCSFRYMPEIKVKNVTRTSEKAAMCTLVLLLAAFGALGVVETIRTYQDGGMISTVASNASIDAIKADGPQRIFNDYNLGEALIFNDIPVFFDARADLYAQENIMADGVSLMYLEQANQSAETRYVDVDGLIAKYRFDAVAILKVRALYSYIVSHPERFSLVYEDSTMAYYRIIEHTGQE